MTDVVDGALDDDPVQRLVELLDLDDRGGDRFVGPNPAHRAQGRVFGGQVAAQGLRAAARTVGTDRSPHSLHAYFLRPGRPEVPIDYVVDRPRDGRSFTTRHVQARQDDEVIFELTASFHVAEPGTDYAQPLAPDVPDPDDAGAEPDFIPEEVRHRMPVEWRELGPTPAGEDGFHRSTRRAWMRTRGSLPDDPILHACVLTFMSDLGTVMGARAPLVGPPLEGLMGASLDHAVWFHRPIRADRWVLFDLRAVSNAGARGLAMGTMHQADGTLGASVAQEALLRVVR